MQDNILRELEVMVRSQIIARKEIGFYDRVTWFSHKITHIDDTFWIRKITSVPFIYAKRKQHVYFEDIVSAFFWPKYLTEEREILNRWTEYCSQLYNHKTNADASIMNCPLTETEDDQPILCKEAEAAVQSLQGSRLVLITSKHNWSKQVERT